MILKKKGVKLGNNRKLNFEQSEFLRQLIINKKPDEIGLISTLWTRKEIQLAVNVFFNIFITFSTISDYMKNFGFSLQKPLKRAYEQNPKLIKHWHAEEYPKIKKKAKKERAEIHWVDETELR